MAFTGASDFSIEGGTQNYVQGNQYINNTTQIVQQQEKKRTIYDEFYDIKLGALRRIRDIYHEKYPRRWDVGVREFWENGRFRADRTFCAAKIRGERSRFTVVSYSGPEAEKAWKKDFGRFSKAMDSKNMQLFGINQSDVPLLIFYDELVPLYHFLDKLEWWGEVFVRTWVWGNAEGNHGEIWSVWMDPKQGTLVCGPEVPDRIWAYLPLLRCRVEVLPSSTELLQEDLSFRFFSRLPLDRAFDLGVIAQLSLNGRFWVIPSTPCVQGFSTLPFTAAPPHVRVFSSLTNSVIAAGRSMQWRSTGISDNIVVGVVMPDGGTRFLLTDNLSSCLELWFSKEDEYEWLSQALSVFYRLGISLNGDLSSYKYIWPSVDLRGSFRHSKVKQQRRLEEPPVYLFLHPLCFFSLFKAKAGSTVSIHTWSFDENGQTPIPHEYCKYLGLPTKLWVVEKPENNELSWSTKLYETIHKWQIVRGFDPTTTDFAHYLGYSTMEIMQSEPLQFEELSAAISASGPSEELLDVPSIVENLPQDVEGQTTISSIWSAITAPFTFIADEDSEISAVMM